MSGLSDDESTLGSDSTIGSDVAASAQIAGEGPGARIGPYRLLQRLGEGGFGTVWMAEQSEPVRRRVALKVLKAGMDTAHVVARFEQERQALALMDHPAIARVLDAGATPSGRPYFVMELVNGEPITRYCDRESLTVRDRLLLFVQVCRAVQHAHQKGVIHRDIKPGNVLVASGDDGPSAKVIDFGVAKAVASRLTERTFFTELQQVIGTPEYMSPEQAEGSLDIDTRTDVYALGVLLYELLTGTTPHSRDGDGGRVSLAEVLRRLREDDVPRPSARVARDPGSLAATASRRRSDPKKLVGALQGELDWIVMKALEKDRRRRYETANGLGMDVERFLAGEPVLAAPPSVGYRVGKFARRHRAAVATAGLLAALFFFASVVTPALLVRATKERDRAQAAEAAAVAARERAEAVNRLLQAALVSSDPNQGGRQEMKVADALAEAVRQLDAGSLRAQPDVEVGLRVTIATVLNLNGHADRALPVAEKAVALARRLCPGDSAELAGALAQLARAQMVLGKSDVAEPTTREVLAMRRRLRPGDDRDTAAALKSVAGALANQGRMPAAEPFFREALEMRRRLHRGDDKDLAQALNDFGYVQMSLGRAEAARPFFEEALAMRRRLFPGDHPDVAEGLNNLAWSCETAHRFTESEEHYREALDMYRRVFAGDHIWVARGLGNLAYSLAAQARWAEAAPLYREAAEMGERLGPGGSTAVADRRSFLGACLLMLGKEREAEETFAEARRAFAAARGSDVPYSPVDVTHQLVSWALVPERKAVARDFSARLAARARRVDPPGSLPLSSALLVRAGFLVEDGEAGDLGEAAALLREVIAIRARSRPDDPRLAQARSWLGGALVGLAEAGEAEPREKRLGRLKEAEPLVLAGLEGLRSNPSAFAATVRARRLASAADRVERLYRLWDRLEPGTGKGALAARALATPAPSAPTK